MVIGRMLELFQIPQRYRFSSKSQHQLRSRTVFHVVLDTTKVQIFKQITTLRVNASCMYLLFQIPQRYRFSSKSQQGIILTVLFLVVLDTTKVQIFKQITTINRCYACLILLFQIPQRYRFSSKSQLLFLYLPRRFCCFRYHKGTDFQANHNHDKSLYVPLCVVLDTTKVQIFKQITTAACLT